jgi:hypothetical protein
MSFGFSFQILAGVTNTSIVLGPNGFVAPGDKLRLPFVLTEADIDTTVILLHDIPAVRMRLETPDGEAIDPAIVTSFGGSFAGGETISCYRFTLPAPLGAGAHGGLWHAILEVDPDIFKRYLSKLDNDPVRLRRARAHGVRYSLTPDSDRTADFPDRQLRAKDRRCLLANNWRCRKTSIVRCIQNGSTEPLSCRTDL